MILVRIDGVPGDCQIEKFDKYFTVESFSFGVERELAESGKSGTQDINIGVGELQECSMSKSMDTASAQLARRAISGSSCATADIKFVESIIDAEENPKNVVYLQFRLDTVFIKTWSMSGDADSRPTEEVALWYNRIAFIYFPTKDGKSFPQGYDCCWDQVKARPWPLTETGLNTACEIVDAK